MQYYKKIKELLSNKRYRSITILAIYVIAFALVGASIRGSFSNDEGKVNTNTPEQTPLQKYEKYSNYHVSYTHNDITLESDIYEKKELITNSNIEYYLDDKLYIKTENGYVLSDMVLDNYYIKLKPSTIKKLIDKGTIKSKGEDYELEATITSYNIKLNNFSELFDTEIEEDDNFIISIYEKNKTIIQIDIDLNSYTKIENDKITIKYTQIAEIKPFDIIIEKQLEV